MIFIANTAGTITQVLYSPVYLNSSAVSEIVLLAPISGNVNVTVGFSLPDGTVLVDKPMTPIDFTNIPPDAFNMFYQQENGNDIPYHVWFYKLGADVTSLAGEVTAQFFWYFPTGNDNEGSNDIGATSSAKFTVQKGVAKISGIPQTPSTMSDVINALNEVYTVLTTVNDDLLYAAYITKQNNFSVRQIFEDSIEVSGTENAVFHSGMEVSGSSTFNGPVTVPEEPTENGHAASKSYVDLSIMDETARLLSEPNTFEKEQTFSKGIYVDGASTIVSLDDRPALTLDGSLQVDGNIIQNGDAYITHAEEVYSKNDLIKLRDGAIGAIPDGTFSGLLINAYDGTTNGLIALSSDGTLRIGDESDTQPVATRAEEGEWSDSVIPVWSVETKSFVPNEQNYTSQFLDYLTIKPQVSGESLKINDSAELKMFSLEILGNMGQDGEPSPNSEVPIRCVKAGTAVKVFSKNLLLYPQNKESPSITIYGVTITVDEDEQTITLNGTFNPPEGGSDAKLYEMNIDIPLDANTKYSLSVFHVNGTINAESSTYHLLYLGRKNPETGNNINWVSTELTNSDVISSVSSSSDSTQTHSIWIYLNSSVQNGITFIDYKFKYMLEESDVQTEYVPYRYGGEVTTPCDLYEGDVWYPSEGKVEKYTSEYILNGEDAVFNIIGVMKEIYFTVQNTRDAENEVNCICDFFKGVSRNYLYDNFGEIISSNSNYIRIHSTTLSNQSSEPVDGDTPSWTSEEVQTARSWFDENHPRVVYRTISPTIESYPPQELPTMIYPTTVIVQFPSEEKATIKSTYIADTKLYIDNKFSELSTAIVASQS